MKNLVIGYGYWGKKIYNSLLRYSKPNVFDKDSRDNSLLSTSLEDYLDDNELENCFVITPEVTHFEITKQCLLKNKNVFVEKPLALSEKEVEDLMELSNRKNKKLSVDSIFLYDSFFIKLKEIFNDKEYQVKLGRVNSINSTRFSVGFDKRSLAITDDLAIHDFYLFENLLQENLFIKTIEKENTEFFQQAKVLYSTESGIKINASYSYLEKNAIRKIEILFEHGKISWDKFNDYLLLEYSSRIEKVFPNKEKLSPIDKMLDDFLNLSENNQTQINILDHRRYVSMLEYLRNENSSF